MITVLGHAVAVAAALLGALVGGAMQQRAHREAARTDRAERHRQDLRAACAALAAALAEHRGHEYWRLRLRADGAGADALAQARRDRYASRAAVTRALVAVQLLTADRALLRAADRAVDAAYALGDARPQTTAIRRADALLAHGALVAAAAATLGAP